MIHTPVKRRYPLKLRCEKGVAYIEVHGETFMMDVEDLHLLEGWTVSIITRGYVTLQGTACQTPRIVRRLHRVVLNAPDEMEVDHISGNKLDNRKSNLRVSTHIENQRNCKRQITSRHPYKGCYCNTNRRSKPWCARITINRVLRLLGWFHTAEEAAEAYNAKALEVFGPFARLNVIMTPGQTVSVVNLSLAACP